MSAWLIETKDFADRWQTSIRHGAKPSEKGPEGAKNMFRTAPIPIPDCLIGLPISIIKRTVLPGGDLKFIDPQTLAKFLTNPRLNILQVNEYGAPIAAGRGRI